MRRTRGYFRYQRIAHIRRKQRIIKDQGGYWHYRYPGELSKGKIHCSCWLCRHKSYDVPQTRDSRRREAMMSDLANADSTAGYDVIEDPI